MNHPIKKINIKGKLLVDPIYAVDNFIEEKQQDFEIEAYFYGGLLSGAFTYDNKRFYCVGDEFSQGNFVLFVYGFQGKKFFINYNENKKEFMMKMHEYKIKSEENKFSLMASIAYMSNARLERDESSEEEFNRNDIFGKIAFTREISRRFRNFFDFSVFITKDDKNRKIFLDMVNAFQDKLSLSGIEDERPRSVLPIAKVIKNRLKKQYLQEHGNEKDIIFSDENEIRNLERNIFNELDEEDYDFCQKSYKVLTNFLSISAQASFAQDSSILPYLAQQIVGQPYLKNYIKETPQQLMAYEFIEVCGEKYDEALTILTKNMEDIFSKNNVRRDLLTELKMEFNENQIDCIIEFYSVLVSICAAKRNKNNSYDAFLEGFKDECRKIAYKEDFGERSYSVN